jgi:transposase
MLMLATTSTAEITLSETDRSRLQTFVHRGQTSARIQTRAHVLLKLAEGWSEGEICAAFDICRNTVVRVYRRFLEGGVDGVLTDKRQERHRQALSGLQQAHLIAIACSPVPDGHDHWTLRMLAGKAVELGFVERISPETIRALLRRTSSNRGSTNTGASQPSAPSSWQRWKILICHVGTGSLCLLAARPVEVRWRAVRLPEEFSAHKG